MRKIRLMVSVSSLNLAQNLEITGSDFDYLAKVMRVKIGDEIEIFNGSDGDFLAKIAQISKKSLALEVLQQIKEQESSSNICLAFAPVKNVKPQFIAQKATELNVSRILPIITHHSVIDSINTLKLEITVKEACEQCERNVIPTLSQIVKLSDLLAQNEIKDKILILCDESGKGQKASEVLPRILKNRQNKEVIVFIGPEGGFSSAEFEKFYELENLTSISLGKNILRADTAMISALSLVNEYL